MNETDRTNTTDGIILIVGAGPTGLTLAIDLARRGVPSLVVEATTERPVNPRCNTTSARSMEIFRRLGVADEIRRAGLPEDYPGTIQYRTTLLGEELFRLDQPSSAEVLAGKGREEWPTPEPQHRVSQIFMEPILENYARSLPGVTIERGTTLVEFREHADHVEAVVDSGGTTRVLHCAYVIGADGAHSVVRRQLGIRYEGIEALQKFVSTFVRSPELGRIAARDRAWTYWTYGRRHASLIAIDGGDRWLHHVAFAADQDTDGEDPEQLLRETVGAPVEHEVLGTVRWTGRQLVATRYREGRAFLAGDAAHIWIPVAGFGMNTGIQDAATLGWMLAAVRNGWAPPELLDAYELERKPVGQQFGSAVAAAAEVSFAEIPPDLHQVGEAGDRARAALSERLAENEPRRYNPHGFSFGYHYAGSPLVVGAQEQQAISMGGYEARAQVGFRLPHAWLDDGRALFDVLGPEFTLLRTDDATDVAPWAEAARGQGIPLTVVDAPGRHPDPLLLVRPDQHIAWMGGAEGRADELLRTVTGRAAAPQR